MKQYLWMLGLVLGFSQAASAAPVKDVSKELDQATHAAINVYRNQGMTGLQKAVNDCYRQVGYATPFCVYLDAAGREIDFTVARAYKELGRNVLPSTFFQAKSFGERTASFYILHQHTRKESNAHMQKIQKQIQKQVNKNLFPQD
ncbi:hypothetical protein [Vitreoscilla stercoraria]|uniref:Uncharacterized protein n=1 Tax=Vitreoscilla stercoraria TaxID=61 RepID=A0ABY4ECL5_VITST|nr:hypothetical protein [Vitreoscilla stercoraria]UOO93487.1 hypothetical protein LVJ81_05540 [Vitreoscilla stercoraria]